MRHLAGRHPSRHPSGWIAAALLLATLSTATAQVVEVPEFAVGTGINRLDVAAGAGDRFVVVWLRFEGSARRVYSRVFSTSGTPLTAETRIDPNGQLTSPRVVGLASGGYIVATQHLTASNNLDDSYGLRLDSLGARVGSAFLVNSEAIPGPAVFPDVALLSSGPVFAWSQFYTRTRRFTSSGTPLEEPTQASQTQASGFFVGIAPLATGGYVAAWHWSFPSSTWGRTFDAAGNPVGDQYLLGEDTHQERVAASPLGGFALVTVRNGSEVWSRRFDDLGAPTSEWVLVDDVAPATGPRAAIEFDTQGNAFVIWSGYFTDPVRYGPLRARVLGALTHEPIAPPVEVSPLGYNVETSRLSDGRFVNVWNTASQTYANIVSVCGAVVESCGNGVIEPPCEVCDDGAANSDEAPDACRTTCRPAGCGDGVVDSREECDDANRASGDGCDQNCLAEFCGNGRREAGEGCDDGNLEDGDGCDSNCTTTGCGNDVLTEGEECEDGNTANGDGCDQGCLIEECGNRRLEGDEECDDGNSIDGDGCDSNCTLSRCGNGILGVDEECDDGNVLNGDGCDRACLVEECGNGRLEGDEACDDGNLEDADGCQADCRPTPVVDAVVLPLRPLKMVLPAAAASVAKTVRVAVRNGDSVGLQIVRLAASDDTCPLGTVTAAPDFSASIDGAQDAVALAPGERAVALLSLRIDRAGFGGLDRKMPRRCTVRLSVGPNAPGSVDSSPENNDALLVLDVYDRAGSGGSEFYLGAAKVMNLRIRKGILAVERPLRLRARSTVPGATFAMAAIDGSCPPGTLTLTEFDEGRGRAKLTVRASRAFFTTPSALSPNRCVAYVIAESAVDGDPGNNVTPVLIDVLDQNDL